MDRNSNPALRNIGGLLMYTSLQNGPGVRPVGHCTATLLSPTVALTAAHCIVSASMRMAFVDNLNDIYDGKNAPSVPITSWWVPKTVRPYSARCRNCSFDELSHFGDELENAIHRSEFDDIALVKLAYATPGLNGMDTPFHFKLTERRIVTLIGYGQQKEDGDIYRLKRCDMVTDIPTKNNFEYKRFIESISNNSVQEIVKLLWILATQPGPSKTFADSCQAMHGDSGAPVILNYDKKSPNDNTMVAAVFTSADGLYQFAYGFYDREYQLSDAFKLLSPNEPNPFGGD